VAITSGFRRACKFELPIAPLPHGGSCMLLLRPPPTMTVDRVFFWHRFGRPWRPSRQQRPRTRRSFEDGLIGPPAGTKKIVKKKSNRSTPVSAGCSQRGLDGAGTSDRCEESLGYPPGLIDWPPRISSMAAKPGRGSRGADSPAHKLRPRIAFAAGHFRLETVERRTNGGARRGTTSVGHGGPNRDSTPPDAGRVANDRRDQ